MREKPTWILRNVYPPAGPLEEGGYALFYGLYRDMAFDLVSILNRVYKFVRVCPKQGTYVCVCLS